MTKEELTREFPFEKVFIENAMHQVYTPTQVVGIIEKISNEGAPGRNTRISSGLKLHLSKENHPNSLNNYRGEV